MASRKINDLQEACAQKAQAFLLACREKGITVLVTCTVRTNAEQAALWAKGRTVPGPVVTWAKMGQSKHESGLAFDVVPIVGGKCSWSKDGEAGRLWQQIGAIGEGVGLTWGGRWTRPDFPHFQDDEKTV